MRTHPFGQDLDAFLTRSDLQAIGLVLVQPGRRSTVTLWCEPDVDPAPLYAQATGAGQEPGGLVLVHGDGVTAFVSPGWRGVGWLTEYVQRLTNGIQRSGSLAGFLSNAAVVWGDPTAAASN